MRRNIAWLVSAGFWMTVYVILALVWSPWLWIAVPLVFISGLTASGAANRAKRRRRARQHQEGGDGSTQVQAGRDVNWD